MYNSLASEAGCPVHKKGDIMNRYWRSKEYYCGVSLREIAAKKERARIASLNEIRKRHGQWA